MTDSAIIGAPPDRLPYLSVPSDEGRQRYYVPLPSNRIACRVNWRRELEEFLMDETFILVGHPRSEIAVLASVISYTRRIGGKFTIVVNTPERVRPVFVAEGNPDELRLIDYEYVDESHPPKEKLESNEFIEKINDLRVKMYVVANGGNVNPSKLDFKSFRKLGINRKSIGNFIDHKVGFGIPLAATNKELEGRMIEILGELNIEERLNKALDFAELAIDLLNEGQGGPNSTGGVQRMSVESSEEGRDNPWATLFDQAEDDGGGVDE